jgi:hypothetical protein
VKSIRVGDTFKLRRPVDEPSTRPADGGVADRHLRLVEQATVCHGYANGCGCARCQSRRDDVPAKLIRQPWEPVHRELIPS